MSIGSNHHWEESPKNLPNQQSEIQQELNKVETSHAKRTKLGQRGIDGNAELEELVTVDNIQTV